MKINQIHRRALSLLLSIALVCGIFGVDVNGAFAAQADNRTTLSLDSGNIVISGSSVTVGSNTVSVNPDGYRIIQRDSGASALHNTISVTGGTADITLENINISASGTAFSIASGAAVNLTLVGTNTLTSGNSHAGLEVPDGAALIVTDTSTGSLTAFCCDYGGAGIGGVGGCAGGSIIINGGTVTATGGENGAGIGGSYNGAGGSITVNGGTVTAYSGWGAASIGGGSNRAGGSITINGGTVLASSNDFAGAGLGGGYGGAGGTFTITGGMITASGSSDGGAGIGGGNNGAGGTIKISGGTVKANGGPKSAGIGGGWGGAGGYVQISGSDTQVTASGATGVNDIGSGKSIANGGTLAVSGTDEEHGPHVEFQSGGTNAAKPAGSAYQFANCKISGDSAKGADGGGISGWYGADGKIRLSALVSAAPKNAASVSFGNPVTLTAHITRYGFGDIPALSGKLSFLRDGGTTIVSGISISGGTASAAWTPADATEHTLTAQYVSDSSDRYALNTKDSIIARYSAGKATPIITAPTASKITAESMLSSSLLSGGSAARADGAEIPGAFAWAQPNLTLTASGSYQVLFTPDDVVNYNTASVMVPVTVEVQPTPTPTPIPTPIPTPTPTPTESRHSSGTPSLPSSITDTASGFQIDLSGVTLPPGVTKVTFSASPAAPNDANNPNAASFFHIVITQANLNVIGIPYIYNIQLLDQNGNPIKGFSGREKVKVPIPAGIVGIPHIFRYEESSGTLTDMNAIVENGFLVFETDHFSCYAIAGTGDSITLDTKSYQMPVNGSYQIGVKLTGNKAATLKVTSTNKEVASEVKLKNGNVQVTGKGIGTAYIMFDVYDSKNKLLTHASVRIDVKTGIRPRGDSTRQTGLF